MKAYGIAIAEGSSITNMAVATGTSFPASPDEGELFFRTDSSLALKGLYCYIAGTWDRIASTESLTAPSGSALPGSANAGDLFYKNSNDGTEGLYAYNDSAWVAVSGASTSFTITGDVSGAIDGGTDVLTLATVNSNVGSFGNASSTLTATVDAKGRVTAISAAQSNIDTSQVISGAFADARIAASNVTQHQGSLSLATSQVTSGTFANARIAASNVTQHQASLAIAESQITDGSLLARNAANEVISGNWTFNNPIVGSEPSAASHLTTKQYVDGVISGLSWKTPVRVATTADITLSGTQTIDGVAVIVGDRVLAKNQSTTADNGIYIVAAGTWTRSTDFDSISPIDEINSAAVFVLLGTVNADTGWTQTAPVTTIGSSAITFVQFSAAGAFSAGSGLTLSANTFNIGTVSTSRIVVNVDDIDLATVTDSGTGTFQKFTSDSYGRITGKTAVTTADITGLVASEYLRLDGTAAMTGGLRISDGSVSSPGIRFADDLTTGIYAPNDFVVAITTQGVERFRVSNNGTSTFTGAGSFVLNLTTPTGNARALRYQTSGADRWGVGVNAAAESGSNAGSDFFIQRHNDAGTAIDAPLYINRATAAVTLTGSLGVGGVITATGGFTGAVTGSASLNVLKAGDNMTGTLTAPQFVTNQTGATTSTRLFIDSPAGQSASIVRLLVAGSNVMTVSPTGVITGASLELFSGGVTVPDGQAINYLNTNTRIAGNGSASVIGIYTSNVERVRVDSTGNVGIGTSGPAFQLDIQGTGGAPMALTRYTDTASSTSISLQHSRGTTVGSNVIVQSGDLLGSILFSGANGTNYSIGARIDGAVDGTPGASADMPGRLTFLTSSDASATPSERLRIDSTGQLGVGGIAPGTWSPSAKALEFAYPAFGMDGTGQGFMSFNLREATSGNWFYKSTDFGLLFRSGGSAGWLWSTAPSGANGTPATLTERMRLTVAGELGIGTTSPGSFGKFSVVNTAVRYFSVSTNGVGTFRYDDNSQPYLSLLNLGMTAINHGYGLNWQLGTDGVTAVNAGRLTLCAESTWTATASTQNSYMAFATTSTGVLNERMRIDSSGNVGIGTATVTAKLDVVGAGDGGLQYRTGTRTVGIGQVASEASVYWGSGTALTFFSGTERVRISSGGDVLISMSAAGNGRLAVDGTASSVNTAIWGKNSGGAATATSVNWNATTTGDSRFIEFYTESTAVLRGNIDFNRAGTAVRYNTSSDARLKKDIVDAPSASTIIDAVQVRSFGWKDSDSHTDYGFVAQELVAIVPDAVSQGDDGALVEKAWAVDYSKLVPLLVKEIQELRARVAALENT